MRSALAACLVLASCATAPREVAAIALIESDRFADEAADGWASFVDASIVRCASRNLPTANERRACLGPAGDSQPFDDALAALVVVQATAYAAIKASGPGTNWLDLADDLAEAIDAIRPFFEPETP